MTARTTMRRRVSSSAVTVLVATAVWTGSTAPAKAAPVVTLGGGAGIVVGSARSVELCTLNSIGRDRTGALVGLTAGHCGVVGEAVRSESVASAGFLGIIATSIQTGGSAAALDYAVIRFDPARVRPSAVYGRNVITGTGPDPRTGGVACKQGRTTGYRCGSILSRLSPTSIVLASCSQPGDSGGPVIVDNRVVGLVRGSVVWSGAAGATGYPRCASRADASRNPTLATSILAVMADLNRRGGVGAGYRPL